MRRVLIALVVALGMVAPAAADTISVLRENTLTLTGEDGKAMTLLIKEGAELEQVNAAGVWASGFWKLEEGRSFCWTARGAASLCIAMPMDRQVGGTWEIAGPTGRIVWKAEIVAGRADLGALSGNGGHGGDH